MSEDPRVTFVLETAFAALFALYAVVSIKYSLKHARRAGL